MLKKAIACFVMIALLLSLTVQVYADEVSITGTFSDKFELTSDGKKLFDIPIMNPGDVWESDLTIKNTTGEKMEVRLADVFSKLDDNLIFNILDVEIYMNGELFYKGPYNEVPQSEWVLLEHGKELKLDIVLRFPGDCGNEYQNKPFDSEWKFEARLPEGVEPDEEDPPVQTGVVRGFYIAGMICLGSVILFIVLGKKKDDEDEKKKK